MTAGTKPEFVIEKLTREHGLGVRLCQRNPQRLATEVRVDKPAGGLRQDLRGPQWQSRCRLLRADDGLSAPAREPAANLPRA